VAFVASETAPTAVGGGPREWKGNLATPAYCDDGPHCGEVNLVTPAHCDDDAHCREGNLVTPAHRREGNLATPAHRREGNLVAPAHCADGPHCREDNLVAPAHCGGGRPVISTFTSPEERAVRARCLRAKRAFIWVCPGGIWNPLPPAIAKACDEGWGFVCSPVPSGTGVNKQRAIWCNQYVIRQAASVWVGSIRPGGSLETLLNSIKGKEEKKWLS